MEDCMRECMRKLAIWYTRNFKPIMTHNELEPIMATLGFVALPIYPVNIECGGAVCTTAWKEYSYSAGSYRNRSRSEPHPRPCLPYPRIDGLHIYTYSAFLDAVSFYLEMTDITDLFHIGERPLHREHDRNKKWRRMLEDDSVFVYREGTLDQELYNIYNINRNSEVYIISKSGGDDSTIIREKGNSNSAGCIVPLKDIIVLP